jgi:predicted lipid-binding transport protein (Tim44 family)
MPLSDEESRRIAIDGLRHGQNLMTGLLGILIVIGFAGVIAFMVYMLQRIDNLRAEFERINETRSSAVTANRQQEPQVIVMPSPTPAPASPSVPHTQPTAPVAPSMPQPEPPSYDRWR